MFHKLNDATQTKPLCDQETVEMVGILPPPSYIVREQEYSKLRINCSTSKEKFKNCIKRTAIILKATSQGLTMTLDTVLLVCYFCIMIRGCQILKGDFEVTTIIYQKWFHVVGIVMVVSGCVNCLIFCPLGFIGALTKNHTMLKWHNFWIFFNFFSGLMLLFSFHQFAKQPEEEKLQQFASDVLEKYQPCVKEKDDCCCFLKNLQLSQSKCWPLDKTIVQSNITDLAKSLQLTTNCQTGVDYYRRTAEFIHVFYWILIVINLTMAGTLLFALITIKTLQLDHDMEKAEPKPVTVTRRYEAKMNLLRTVFIYFFIKKFFWVCFLIIIPCVFHSFKMFVLKKIRVTIPAHLAGGQAQSTNMQELMGAFIFGLIMVQIVAVPDDAKREETLYQRSKIAKTRFRWILQRIRYHIFKRLLLILLSVLFLFGYFFVKLWMKNFTLKVGAVRLNVWSATIDYLNQFF